MTLRLSLPGEHCVRIAAPLWCKQSLADVGLSKRMSSRRLSASWSGLCLARVLALADELLTGVATSPSSSAVWGGAAANTSMPTVQIQPSSSSSLHPTVSPGAGFEGGATACTYKGQAFKAFKLRPRCWDCSMLTCASACENNWELWARELLCRRAIEAGVYYRWCLLHAGFECAPGSAHR